MQRPMAQSEEAIAQDKGKGKAIVEAQTSPTKKAKKQPVLQPKEGLSEQQPIVPFEAIAAKPISAVIGCEKEKKKVHQRQPATKGIPPLIPLVIPKRRRG